MNPTLATVPDTERAGRAGAAEVCRYVPVRTVGAAQVLRLFRQRDGSRCAVEFSSPAALHALLGPDQEVAELTERALRQLTAPLGVHRLLLDPGLVAPATHPGAEVAALGA
ncbi:SAV_915 family protein [Kitasatospora sp. MMS16-BH015]|uniref:SAV_915 family protein n=1 Tax=Kitasatospora sp. MMS16-BH015 TaxID=2018025 RepID=UPI000CF286E2|nr:SAV_915 family protein [Kitasatospora sp. MMS16-BH015]